MGALSSMVRTSAQEADDYWRWLHASIALLAVGLFFVGLRLAARAWLSRRKDTGGTGSRWLWEDVLIVPAALALIAMGVPDIVSSSAYTELYGPNPGSLGRRQQLVVRYNKAALASSAAYPLACMFSKISLCCLYLRIFSQKHIRWTVWLLVAFLLATGISFFIATLSFCSPLSYYWRACAFIGLDVPAVSTGTGRCINGDALSIASNPPQIVSDVVLLLLPLPTIWRLKTSIGLKIGVTITFMSGILGLLASILRWESYLSNINGQFSTHTSAVQAILTYLEPTMYTITACLPSLRETLLSLWSPYHSSWQVFSIEVKRASSSSSFWGWRKSSVTMSEMQQEDFTIHKKVSVEVIADSSDLEKNRVKAAPSDWSLRASMAGLAPGMAEKGLL